MRHRRDKCASTNEGHIQDVGGTLPKDKIVPMRHECHGYVVDSFMGKTSLLLTIWFNKIFSHKIFIRKIHNLVFFRSFKSVRFSFENAWRRLLTHNKLLTCSLCFLPIYIFCVSHIWNPTLIIYLLSFHLVSLG